MPLFSTQNTYKTYKAPDRGEPKNEEEHMPHPLTHRPTEAMAQQENGERRRRQGRSSFVTSPVAGVRRGLPFFTEYGPTYPETPGLVVEAVEREKLLTRGADVARLAGELLTPHAEHTSPSRFVSGHLSLKEVDAPDLTIRKAPSGTIEVVIRYD